MSTVVVEGLWSTGAEMHRTSFVPESLGIRHSGINQYFYAGMQ